MPFNIGLSDGAKASSLQIGAIRLCLDVFGPRGVRKKTKSSHADTMWKEDTVNTRNGK